MAKNDSLNAIMYGVTSMGVAFGTLARIMDNVSLRASRLEAELLQGANYLGAMDAMNRERSWELMVAEASFYGAVIGFTAIGSAYYLLRAIKKD